MKNLGLLVSLALLGVGILQMAKSLASLSFDWKDLPIFLGIAVLAYGMVGAVGLALNRRFEAAVARFLAGEPREILHDRGLLGSFGLLMVVMLPLLVYLLLFGLYAAILFTTQGLALMDAAYRVPVALPIALLIIAVGTVIGTALGFYYLVFPPGHQPLGLWVPESRDRPLWDLIRETAVRLKAKRVHDVVISPQPGIGVYQRGNAFLAMLGLGRRTLVIGLPSLHGLSVAEFGAILSHEYGHFSHRDTQWSAFTYVMGNSLLTALRSTPGPSEDSADLGLVALFVALNPAHWILRLLASLYFGCTGGFSRVGEVMADLRAMEIYGGEAFAGGLRKVVMNDLVFAERVQGKIHDALSEGKPIPDFSRSLAESYPQGDTPETRRFHMEFLSLLESTGPYDSHPPVKLRLEYAQRFPDTEGADSRPVTELFDDWEKLNAKASDLYNRRLLAYLKSDDD